MPRSWTLVCAVAILAQGSAPRLDLSGVDQFWKIGAALARDVEPSEADWRALLDTPGYRLAAKNVGGLRNAIDLALKPSRHAEFSRASAGDDDHAQMLKHIALAWSQRAALRRYEDSLAHADVITGAVSIAARLLPAGATRRGAPPPVAVAIFKDDGFSLPEGIVVDLLNVSTMSLATNLAHEFHHSYVNRLARPVPAGNDTAADEALRATLYNLRNEGIADQIDKPHPFVTPNPGLAAYARQYNAEYARTPEAIRQLDQLLTSVAGDPSALKGRDMEIQMIFWSNGHPNGAYMAREIQETFGADSLRAAALNPAVFLRQFVAAERAHRRPDPFSPKAWQEIERLDVKYWK